MKLDVFCAWGDGPDVGINIYKIENGEVSLKYPVFLDFTASEARELAAKLIACAEAAEAMDRSVEEYERDSTSR